MIKLSIHADDRSTYFLEWELIDRNKQPAVPAELTWTLLGPERQVINGRDKVPINPTASSGTVEVYDADIDYADGSYRYFVLEGKYDSDEGPNRPLRTMARFFIDEIYEAKS